MKTNQDQQLTFIAPNGYLTPCPHKDKCGAYKLPDGVRPDGTTYTRGCGGNCYWCGKFDKEKTK